MKKKMKNMKKKAATIITALIMTLVSAANVFATEAAGNEVITAINKLDDIIFGIIKAIGMGFAAWGILNFASSIPSHDSGQRMIGFTTVTAGLIAIFAKEILKAIGAV